MNITIANFRAVAKALLKINATLERLADVQEYSALKNLNYVPRPKHLQLSVEEREVSVSYTDEERDAVREFREKIGALPESEKTDEVS